MNKISDCIVLSTPKTQNTAPEAVYSFVLDDPGNSKPETYYIAVPAEYKSWLSTSLDPSLPIGLLRAMVTGKALSVDGPVDPVSASRIENEWQRLLSSDFVGLRHVPVTFSSYESEERSTPLAHVLAFSGGVDSTYSLLHLLERAKRSAPAITHLLFIGYERFSHVSASRLAHIQQVANELGLPLISVRTNVDAAFVEPVSPSYWLYTKIHEILFVAVATALGRNSVNFYFSSTYTVETTNAIDRYQSSNSLALFFSWASCGSATLHVEGAGVTRFQKIAAIANSPLAQRTLDVCDASFTGKARNCSRCTKCSNTLVMLDALGATAGFEQLFDIAIFQKNRTRTYLRILTSGSPITREITESIRTNSGRTPFIVRLILAARLDFLLSRPNKLFRSIKGWVLVHTFSRKIVRNLQRRRDS